MHDLGIHMTNHFCVLDSSEVNNIEIGDSVN